MLRLVHPAPEGQAPARRRKGIRSAALILSTEETRHLRVAIRNAARAYGTLACLADAIGVPVHTIEQALYRKGKGPSGVLAIRVARAAGVAVETVLTGALNAAGRCATCGHRAGDGRAVLTAGGAR